MVLLEHICVITTIISVWSAEIYGRMACSSGTIFFAQRCNIDCRGSEWMQPWRYSAYQERQGWTCFSAAVTSDSFLGKYSHRDDVGLFCRVRCFRLFISGLFWCFYDKLPNSVGSPQPRRDPASQVGVPSGWSDMRPWAGPRWFWTFVMGEIWLVLAKECFVWFLLMYFAVSCPIVSVGLSQCPPSDRGSCGVEPACILYWCDLHYGIEKGLNGPLGGSFCLCESQQG